QWIRHRTANVNEYSTRYSVAIDATQTTAPDAWRRQAASNRQGSEGTFAPEVGAGLTQEETRFQANARDLYQRRINAGVAREQARKDLPLATYTEAYWKIDLHNLLHFLALRMDAHAQAEIRAYATIIGEEIVRRWIPLTWEAFVDYRLSAMALTRLDVEVLRAIAGGGSEAGLRKAEGLGIATPNPKGGLKRNRERDELEAKLVALGLPIPW
ncbi:MAG: FAD-dependent thymidylate synthase, partial [Deltaproteobacteria bacterium]|nr:FAD-dependent thymidylate synthase [Deltaproteobacteria bacterium]